jgi:hypothetical protein
MPVPHDLFDEFRRKYNKLLEPIIRALKKTKNLKLSEVDKLIDELFLNLDIEEKVSNIITDISIKGAILGDAIIPKEKFKETAENLLKNNWFDDNLILSERIHANIKNIKNGIKSTVKETLGASVNWNKTAGKIFKIKNLNAELPQYMKNVLRVGKKALVDPALINVYNRKLKIARRNIEKLSNLGLQNPRLKKAYNNLLKQVEKGSIEGIEKGIERAVLAKTRYYAERIARTEIASAYGNAVMYSSQKDNNIVAIRSVLSSRHNILDICDVHARVDQYGCGKGVFPKNKVPPFPYHPNCMCSLVPMTANQVDCKKSKVSRKKQIKKFVDQNPKVAIQKTGKIPHLTNDFIQVRKPINP